VGKTTTTLNLAHALAEDGRTKVLLCDLDPQASLTTLLGVEAHSLPASVYDLLVERPDVSPDQVVRPTSMTGVSLLPSTIDLSKAESELLAEPGRDHLLARVLAQFRDQYDFILCDCPPSLGILTSNVLAAADEVLVPMSSDFLALRALEHLLANVEKIRRRVNPRCPSCRSPGTRLRFGHPVLGARQGQRREWGVRALLRSTRTGRRSLPRRR
jgi:chromosome partitioning protein